jgi:hypothetical protein
MATGLFDDMGTCGGSTLGNEPVPVEFVVKCHATDSEFVGGAAPVVFVAMQCLTDAGDLAFLVSLTDVE